MLMWRVETPGGGSGICCQVANVGDSNGVAAWPARQRTPVHGREGHASTSTTRVAARWEHDSRSGGWRRVLDHCDDTRGSTWNSAGPGPPPQPPAPSTSRWRCEEGLWEQHTVVEVTQTHRLTNKKERERLLEAGVPLRPGENRLYGMAISRALGDHFMKGEGVPLLAEPSIAPTFFTRAGEASLVILASDGLWDVTSPQQAVELALEAGRRAGGDPKMMAAALGKHARERRSADDITVMVILIGGEPSLSPPLCSS
mmetsp:Transcript_36229/g.79066  ORF Transcript_36229/g.79066 Transcript_36229/m.79066 type:complete len:257 (-) Transcript_36229:126-896(-)